MRLTATRKEGGPCSQRCEPQGGLRGRWRCGQALRQGPAAGGQGDGRKGPWRVAQAVCTAPWAPVLQGPRCSRVRSVPDGKQEPPPRRRTTPQATADTGRLAALLEAHPAHLPCRGGSHGLALHGGWVPPMSTLAWPAHTPAELKH